MRSVHLGNIFPTTFPIAMILYHHQLRRAVLAIPIMCGISVQCMAQDTIPSPGWLEKVMNDPRVNRPSGQYNLLTSITEEANQGSAFNDAPFYAPAFKDKDAMSRGMVLADSILAAFIRTGNNCGAIAALGARSSIHADRQEYQLALDAELLALKYAVRAQDTLSEIGCLSSLKNFFNRRNLYDEALRMVDRSLALTLALKDSINLPDLYRARVYVLNEAGRNEEALATIRTAQQPVDTSMRSMVNNETWQLTTFEVFIHQRDFVAAYELAASHRPMKDFMVPMWQLMQAQALDSLGRYTEALALFQQALEAAKSFDELEGFEELGELVAELAALHLSTGDAKEAERITRNFLRTVSRNTTTVYDHMAIHKTRSAACAGLGQWQEAFASLAAYDQIADSLENEKEEVNRTKFQLQYIMGQRLLADSLEHKIEMGRTRTAAAIDLTRERNRRNIFLFSGLGLLIFGAVVFRQRGRIQKALHRSDELLLNILPAEVAEELKDNGSALAKQFDSATILFSDFKGFTQASEKLTPQELVEELNTCFKAFDHIITARGIEKIKTIGDAYMCAGGLPDPKTTSPADVVHAALEMQAFMVARKKERDALGKPAFEMRVGIHTGPVVAGIVGVKKFQYDIWGDTVNTASRMESSGEVGQVNISEVTYELVKDVNGDGSMVNGKSRTDTNSAPIHHSPSTIRKPAFTFTSRGKVQVKGKGEMEMYFVEG